MRGHDLVVVGASAGGLGPLMALVGRLPAGFPSALCVVIHIPHDASSQLPMILSRSGALPAMHPVDGQPIERGHIYVAPPGRHLLVEGGHLRLSTGPRENGHRPAVDPLFRSAAYAFGPRVIAVVLSGALDDGAFGAAIVKNRRGLVVVQDPEEAEFPGMPESTLQATRVDALLPASGIGDFLTRTILESTSGRRVGEEAMEEGRNAIPGGPDLDRSVLHPAPDRPDGLTCPECGGALWERREGNALQYRCHVGHAFSADSIVAEQELALESALWTAIRMLKERAALLRRLAESSQAQGERTAIRFTERADDIERQAALIQTMVLRLPQVEDQPA